MKTRELSPCGTHAAYKRHLKRGEEPCAECRAANVEQTLASRAKARRAKEPLDWPDPPGSDCSGREWLEWLHGVLWQALVWAREFDPSLTVGLSRELREVNRLLHPSNGGPKIFRGRRSVEDVYRN